MFRGLRGTRGGGGEGWDPGRGRRSGSARGRVKGTESRGETEGPGEGGWEVSDTFLPCVPLPSGLCGEDWGLAEEQRAGGGCSSPGHCLCGGERHPWDSFWGIWAIGAVGEGCWGSLGLGTGALVVSGVSWVGLGYFAFLHPSIFTFRYWELSLPAAS